MGRYVQSIDTWSQEIHQAILHKKVFPPGVCDEQITIINTHARGHGYTRHYLPSFRWIILYTITTQHHQFMPHCANGNKKLLVHTSTAMWTTSDFAPISRTFMPTLMIRPCWWHTLCIAILPTHPGNLDALSVLMAHSLHRNIADSSGRIGNHDPRMFLYNSLKIVLWELSTNSELTILTNLNQNCVVPPETTGCREETTCFLCSSASNNRPQSQNTQHSSPQP